MIWDKLCNLTATVSVQPDQPEPLAPRPIETHAAALELVRSVRVPTPLEPAPGLDAELAVLLKREDLGPNGSFKWRGSLCALSQFAFDGAAAVVTASTGNHGAATAWAAARLGLQAHVIVPADASGLKCSLIERNGARLHRIGRDLDSAVESARELAEQLAAPYFEDGATTAQLLGTGTIGHELAGSGVGTVIAPLAVGALVGGIGLGLAAAGSRAPLYGVQAEGYDMIARRLQGEGERPSPTVTFADGLADNRIVEPAFSICREHLEGVVVASEDELEAAVTELHQRSGVVAEGAGAAALAGLRTLRSGELQDPVALIVSGRNLDREIVRRLLPLGAGYAH